MTQAAQKQRILNVKTLRLTQNARIITTTGNTESVITNAEMAVLSGRIDSAVAVLTAGGSSDEMDITISVKDAAGSVIAGTHNLEVWITDDAATLTITGTGASGNLTAIDGGILSVLTAKKHIICVTPATGIINLSLFDNAKTAGEYVVVKLPNGLFSISDASVTGSYGT